MQTYDYLFIGGAGGSGKTTLIPYLKNVLGPSWQVADFDSIGVPENPDKKWRQQATENWLKKMLNAESNFCLTGQIVLGEILSSPSASLFTPLTFCLLDVADDERLRRLKKRDGLVDPAMFGWANWLRQHNNNPQERPHVVTDDAWEKLDTACWQEKNSWEGLAQTSVIDTTHTSPKEIALQIQRLTTK